MVLSWWANRSLSGDFNSQQRAWSAFLKFSHTVLFSRRELVNVPSIQHKMGAQLMWNKNLLSGERNAAQEESKWLGQRHTVTKWWRQSSDLDFVLGVYFFKRFYLFLERWKEREKEGERNIDVLETHRLVVSHTPPTWDLALNLGLYSDWESNWWPFGLQANTQSTGPHQELSSIATMCLNGIFKKI